MGSVNFKESNPAAEAGFRNVKFRMAASTTPGIDSDISGEVPNLGGVNPQTGTSYALVAADQGKLVTLSNAAAVALSLVSTLPVGFICWVSNLGAATATLTPSSGTINGDASVTLAAGNGAALFFDGTNWKAVTGGGGGSAQVNADWNAVSGVAQILNKPTVPVLSAAPLNSVFAGGTGAGAADLYVQGTVGYTPTTLDLPFPSPNTAGNVLLAYTNSWGGLNLSSDTQLNTWIPLGVWGGGEKEAIWCCPKAKAGSNTVSFTGSGGAAVLIELSANVMTPSTIDLLTSVDTGSGTSTTATSGSSVAQSEELVIAVVRQQGWTGSTPTLSVPSDWAILNQWNWNVGSINDKVSVVAKRAISGLSGTQSLTTTSTSSGTYWYTKLFSLRLAASTIPALFRALVPNDISFLDTDSTMTANSDAKIATQKATKTALAGKESSLGNPSVDGYVLSSTVAGSRSWVPPPTGGGGGALTKIAEQILGSSAATVNFTSIPQTYRNLKLVITGRSDSANSDIYMQFNGDTGTNYDGEYTYNNGAGATSAANYGVAKEPIGGVAISTSPANYAGSTELVIYDYARTAWMKNATGRSQRKDAASTGYVITVGFMWRNTAAITSILLGINPSGNFVTGSVFTLYGES